MLGKCHSFYWRSGTTSILLRKSVPRMSVRISTGITNTGKILNCSHRENITWHSRKLLLFWPFATLNRIYQHSFETSLITTSLTSPTLVLLLSDTVLHHPLLYPWRAPRLVSRITYWAGRSYNPFLTTLETPALLRKGNSPLLYVLAFYSCSKDFSSSQKPLAFLPSVDEIPPQQMLKLVPALILSYYTILHNWLLAYLPPVDTIVSILQWSVAEGHSIGLDGTDAGF